MISERVHYQIPSFVLLIYMAILMPGLCRISHCTCVMSFEMGTNPSAFSSCSRLHWLLLLLMFHVPLGVSLSHCFVKWLLLDFYRCYPGMGQFEDFLPSFLPLSFFLSLLSFSSFLYFVFLFILLSHNTS